MHDNGTPADPDLPVDFGLLLRLEHAVADMLANPGPPEIVFPALLGAIGLALAWPVGGVWLPPDRIDDAGAGLRCAATWHDADVAAEAAEFAEVSRDLTLRVGVGLPGRVWASGQPAWVRDARRDPDMPRAGAAARAGLAAAFCFPATSSDGVEALVEFFCRTPLEPAPELLATVQSLGLRIGDALRRQRIDDAVRRSEARLRAVIESALDCAG